VPFGFSANRSEEPVKGRTQSSENTISKRVWIRASPEVVYKALTEAKELVHWFCDQALCDLREGGDFAARWRTGKTTQKGRARFMRLSPGAGLELHWIDDGRGIPETVSNHTLSYEIRSKSGMTELIMIDTDDSASDEETYSVLDQGWNSVLMELKDYCERKERSVKPQLRSKASRSKAHAE
jgi:uncharacterized protein YndB with AHSA1/START domain